MANAYPIILFSDSDLTLFEFSPRGNTAHVAIYMYMFFVIVSLTLLHLFLLHFVRPFFISPMAY